MKRLRSSLQALVSAAVLIMLVFSGLSLPGMAKAAPYTAPVTVITVNSGTDPDVSDSQTCITHSPCTLRRAIIQARGLPANQKPVLIAFNIPATPAEGYVSSLQIWKIQFSGISSSANSTLRYLNGGIIIDGGTQPGGRTAGPKIFLVGPGTGQWDGLKLGENATQNANEIRGLGFQMFKTHIYVNSSSNIVENNWFGLSDNGMNVVLRGGGDKDGSGNTGVSVGANIANNIIRNNVFTGLSGVAAAINGNDTTFSNNYIGTIANGTVPDKEKDPSLVCLAWDWLGGGGISISGNRNVVENNVIAGIRIAVTPPTIQADSIRMGGNNHIIRNNRIGRDTANAEIGVCGRGIYLLSGTKFNQITSNQIIQPGLSAISLNDTPTVSTSDANTLRSNVIKKNTPWGEIEGNASPEDAIQMTKSLPVAFRNFQPAKVTSINGKQVLGTNGTGSLCPNCVIEIFLDDRDTINEALQSLAVVNADANGNWTATLPAALTASQGLRTTSTTAKNNTISGMSMGTTTGLSVLYTAKWSVYMPLLMHP
jgi:hypothetical protein